MTGISSGQPTFDASTALSRAADFAPRIGAAIAIAIAYYMLWRVVRRALGFASRRTDADRTAVAFVETAVKYAIFIVAAVTALGQIGVDTVSIVASLGVVGLTLGFAAKDVLSNLIAGIFIFWDRPFVLGDLIEIAGNYGRVELITLRSTRVVTPDGRMLAVPNTVVINGTVTSYTNFPHLRLDIPVTINVREDIGRVRALLIRLCRPEEGFLEAPAPAVVVTALNDYNVKLELQAWIADEKQHIARRFELREKVFETLRSSDVDMPFETIRLAPIELAKAS